MPSLLPVATCPPANTGDKPSEEASALASTTMGCSVCTDDSCALAAPHDPISTRENPINGTVRFIIMVMLILVLILKTIINYFNLYYELQTAGAIMLFIDTFQRSK
jgi:hypothetical protein